MLTYNLEKVKTSRVDEYTALSKNKIDWQTLPMKRETLIPQVESAFSKCVALGLELELPVGGFIRAVLDKQSNIPLTAINGLIENIEDEENHFKAFTNMQCYLRPGHREKASEFRKQCLHVKTSPLIKARDLESYVFLPLQGFMRLYGNQSIERVIANISMDEFRHCNYNWLLSADLKTPRDKMFENFTKTVVSWVFPRLSPLKRNG